jgi:hypothetical protein
LFISELAQSYSIMKKIILFLFVLMPVLGFSQNVPDVHAHSPKPEKTAKAQRAAEKKKQKQKRQQEKADKKAAKQLVKMQTKDVQKRMRQNRHKAKLYNQKKKEFFIVRWFRKKTAYQ